jgi:hypothetical protein
LVAGHHFVPNRLAWRAVGNTPKGVLLADVTVTKSVVPPQLFKPMEFCSQTIFGQSRPMPVP